MKHSSNTSWGRSILHKSSLPIIFLVAIILMTACSNLPDDQTPIQPAGLETVSSSPTPESILDVEPSESTPTPEDTQTVETPESSPTPEATLTSEAPPIPTCSPPADLTPALTEGPYYTANTPERNSLIEPGTQGTRLTLTGYVMTADCQPVANAWLDFWQAGAEGVYDNSGYTLRGHQYTDENGRYQLITVVPGQYPGRTEHIHFKVQAPGGPVLTSQLFFPGISEDDGDRIYDPALLIHIIQEDGDSLQATFDFIIQP